MSEKHEIEIKNANIKSTQVYYIEFNDMEFKYSKNTDINIDKDYLEIGDNDIRELVLEVKIIKLVSLRNFDT